MCHDISVAFAYSTKRSNAYRHGWHCWLPVMSGSPRSYQSRNRHTQPFHPPGPGPEVPTRHKLRRRRRILQPKATNSSRRRRGAGNRRQNVSVKFVCRVCFGMLFQMGFIGRLVCPVPHHQSVSDLNNVVLTPMPDSRSCMFSSTMVLPLYAFY